MLTGNEHVLDADGDAGLGGVNETKFLQLIERDHGALKTKPEVAVINQLLDALLLDEAVDERHLFGKLVVEDHAARGRADELLLQLNRRGMRDVLIVVSSSEVDQFAGVAQANRRKKFNFARFKRQDHFLDRPERAAFALRAGLALGHVIDAQHHVLRRHGQRQAVGWRQDVARGKHQHGRFNLRLGRERNVHRHLVAVKVRVERRADQWMNADSLTLDQNRLEGLNTQTVKRGSAVQRRYWGVLGSRPRGCPRRLIPAARPSP